MTDIRTRLICYRLYTNDRGFDDWERYPKYDLETTDDSDAIIHMSECTDKEMGFERARTCHTIGSPTSGWGSSRTSSRTSATV